MFAMERTFETRCGVSSDLDLARTTTGHDSAVIGNASMQNCF